MNINSSNYEEYLIRKLENLLNQEETREFDSFMQNHPELLSEWEAFKQTVLVADEEITFTDKASLKKPERERRVVPLYRTLLIVTGIAASLLFVVYLGVFKFKETNSTTPIASNHSTPGSSSVTNYSSQVQGTSSAPTPSIPLIAQNTPIVSTHILSHHAVQPFRPAPALTSNSVSSDPQNNSSLPVELASLSPAPVGAIPLKMDISLAPYKSIPVTQTERPVINPHPDKTVQHASLIQFASVLGTELYHLSGRGESSTDNPQIPARNDVSVSVSTKQFSLLKTFHFHPGYKTIQSK
jgi:hypothetical protein